MQFKVLEAICQVCHKQTQMMCQYCKTVFYCSKAHQKQDWKEHRKLCFGEETQSDLVETTLSTPSKTEEPQIRLRAQTFEVTSTRPPKQQDQLLVIQEPISKERQAYVAQFLRRIKYRDQQRSTTLLSLFQQNFNNAVMVCKRLILLSSKILSDTNEQICNDLMVIERYRTSKFLQEIECLQDMTILCKIYQQSNKREECRKILNTIMFPQSRSCPFINKPTSKEQINSLNVWKEQISRYCAVLKQLIAITVQLRLITQLEQVYTVYINLVKTNFNGLELATVYFEVANVYQQLDLVDKALQYFRLCRKIRQKFGDSLALADALFNQGLIDYYGNQNSKKQAISLVERALLIKKDKLSNTCLEITPLLETLGKFYLEELDFVMALKRFMECHKIRKAHLQHRNKEKVRTQVLIVFLYKTIKKELQITKNPQLTALKARIEKEVFQLEDFDLYKLDEDIEKINFKLNIGKELFDQLDGPEIEELSILKVKLGAMSYDKGREIFLSSTFFRNISEGKKNLLQLHNPNLRLASWQPQ